MVTTRVREVQVCIPGEHTVARTTIQHLLNRTAEVVGIASASGHHQGPE